MTGAFSTPRCQLLHSVGVRATAMPAITSKNGGNNNHKPKRSTASDTAIKTRVAHGKACCACSNTPITCGTTQIISPATTSSATQVSRIG